MIFIETYFNLKLRYMCHLHMAMVRRQVLLGSSTCGRDVDIHSFRCMNIIFISINDLGMYVFVCMNIEYMYLFAWIYWMYVFICMSNSSIYNLYEWLIIYACLYECFKYIQIGINDWEWTHECACDHRYIQIYMNA